MEDIPKLEGMGILYMEVLKSADLSVTEESPGTYKVKGTSPAGNPIEGYLDSRDFNSCSKRLQHILGLIAEKPEGTKEPLHHQEHYIIDPESMEKKQEIDRLLGGDAEE